MASSSASSQRQVSSGSEEATATGSPPQQIVDIRKRKRMLSNRESARRSRLRKQTHLDDLTAQVSQLRSQNSQIVTTVGVTTQQYLKVEAENSVLRAQMDELSNRLQSLNDIINCLSHVNNNNSGMMMTTTTTAAASATVDSDQESFGGCFDVEFDDGYLMEPWGFSFASHPVMPVLDAFMC